VASSAADNFKLLNSLLNGGAATAVRLNGADNVLIGNNAITGATGVAAVSFGTLSVNANHFTTATAGVRLEPGDSVENAQVTGNTFVGGQYGVSLQGNSPHYTDDSIIVVSGNTFLGQSTGVHADGAMPASLDS